MQESWIPSDKRVLGVFVPLIEALTERLATWPARFVFLGSGEARYERLIERLDAERHVTEHRSAF